MYQDNRISPNFLFVTDRVERQYDLDRVYDEDKDMASIFGPFPNSYVKNLAYAEPNHEIDADGGVQEITISGVRIKINPMEAELLDTLMISLPDDKVVYTGDNFSDTFPPIFTPRLLGDRDPKGLIRAINYMMTLIDAGEVEHAICCAIGMPFMVRRFDDGSSAWVVRSKISPAASFFLRAPPVGGA